MSLSLAATAARAEPEERVSVACPNCAAVGLTIFYEARNVPVHNSLIQSTRQEALDFPRGDVVLGFCGQCGFIGNAAFDPRCLGYSRAYEDQQSFSPTFNAFARELAAHLIDKYGLRDKTIVEIGCGKGDFLALLCELGHNRGVGIDPAAIPERLQSDAAQRITFVQDYYSPKYAHYRGDLVCCRHTLEHIAPTAEFLTTVRRSIGDRLDTAVFFEVPDVLRVLREQAYWDIYYEHCSYFGPGSLARLFRRSGFDVTSVSLGFDDQYVLLEARPVALDSDGGGEPRGAGTQALPPEESVEQMRCEVEAFARRVKQKLDYWKTHLVAMKQQNKRAVVWGSGSKCVSFLSTVGAGACVDYVVDINPHRHGKFIPGVGKEIMPPEFLRAYAPDEVIVMNAIYLGEIRRALAQMQITCAVVAV